VTWLLLLKNRYVQYALLGVIVIAMLLAVRKHYIDVGKDAGREETKQDEKQSIEQARSAEHSQAVAAIAQKDAEAREARARADAAESMAAQFVELNRTLISQRAAVAGKVNATPDSELHAANTTALGIRQAGDATPGYYPTEERSVLSCLLDRPIIEKQTKALQSAVDENSNAIKELKNQVQAQQGKYDALAGYTTHLETYYTQIANLWPKKTRGKKCAFLWACSKNLLPVPDPADLKGSKPK
jgi:hypothetical protein